MWHSFITYKDDLFDKVGQVTQEKKLICRKSLEVFSK